MDRRTFFKAVAVAGGATLLAGADSHALQFYPHPAQQEMGCPFRFPVRDDARRGHLDF